MRQLAIDLPHRVALGRADFLVSDCNRTAFELIERWPDWPARGLVLYGPEGCGKTHLAQLWRERSGAVAVAGSALHDGAVPAPAAPAVVIEDAEHAPQQPLLHFYNAAVEQGASLLILTRLAPSAWRIALADLASRIRGLPWVGIAAPDDALLAAVLVKHFADRQLEVGPEVIAYLLPRMERSFAAAAALARDLDRRALAERSPVTLRLARRVLDDAAQTAP